MIQFIVHSALSRMIYKCSISFLSFVDTQEGSLSKNYITPKLKRRGLFYTFYAKHKVNLSFLTEASLWSNYRAGANAEKINAFHAITNPTLFCFVFPKGRHSCHANWKLQLTLLGSSNICIPFSNMYPLLPRIKTTRYLFLLLLPCTFFPLDFSLFSFLYHFTSYFFRIITFDFFLSSASGLPHVFLHLLLFSFLPLFRKQSQFTFLLLFVYYFLLTLRKLDVFFSLFTLLL